MGNGLEFDYLIDEPQNKFFQDVSEGIAKDAFFGKLKQIFRKKPSGVSAKTTGDELAAAAEKRVGPKGPSQQKAQSEMGSKELFKEKSEEELKKIFGTKALADIRKQLAYSSGYKFGHGGKLAMLILESNHNRLQKEAGKLLYDFKSYTDIVNGVALSAFWEPLGMTKSASLYLDEINKLGVDNTELANRLFGDSVETDVVIESVMQKLSGDSRSLEEIHAEIMKIAQATVIPKMLRALKGTSALKGLRRPVPSVAGPLRAPKVLGEAAAKSGAKTSLPSPEKTTWWERFRGKGIKETALAGPRRIGTEVKGLARRGLGKLRASRVTARSKYVASLERERAALQKQLAVAKAGQAEQIGTRLQALNAKLSRQQARLTKAKTKVKAGQEAAGIGPGVKPKTKPHTPAAPSSKKIERIEKQMARNYEQGHGPKPPGYVEYPGAKPEQKAVKQQRVKQQERTLPKPERSPSEAVTAAQSEGKAGMLASAKKWEEAGWDALTGAEKRQIYKLLGITFVAQRAVMDKPII